MGRYLTIQMRQPLVQHVSCVYGCDGSQTDESGSCQRVGMRCTFAREIRQKVQPFTSSGDEALDFNIASSFHPRVNRRTRLPYLITAHFFLIRVGHLNSYIDTIEQTRL